MTRVSISELKAHLSRYLREVRRGGEIQVLDRGVPIARLSRLEVTPLRDTDRRARLIKGGVLWPGSGAVGTLLAKEPIKLETSILKALEEERADRL